ncbi:MAG: TolC family protein [Proteobacteria bacterium]|nr:TolC family protein [Pseudomonadota bacterium]MCP4916134.1 TolC family protein [Pseudomonadota bacterium]
MSSLGALLAMTLLLLVTSTAEAVETFSPADAVAAAMDNNPELRSAEAALSQAEAQLSQALGGNPRLSGSMLVDGPTELQIRQPVSVTGEGIHRRRAASSRVDAAAADLERARFELAHAVRATYVDAVVAIGLAEVADQGLVLADQLQGAVSRLHEEGEASQLDEHLARLAHAQAAARALGARESEAEALAELSGMVTRLIDPASLERELEALAPSSPAHAERSDVTAAHAALLAAERELVTQRAATLPPLGVGVRAESEGGVTTVGPSLSVEVPLLDRNQAGKAGAQGDLRVAEARLAETQAVADTEVMTGRERDEVAQQALAALGEAPLASAVAALKSVEAGYLAGELELIETVLLQDQILEGETALVQLEGFVARARLDVLLAVEDPALLGH